MSAVCGNLPDVIAHLKGSIGEKSADRLVVEVGGVGYEVLIPFSTYYELGEVGDTVSLRIYTHVKEDALVLYGFLSNREKALFVRLIQLSGVGPKLAVAILSGLPVDDFVRAVREADVGRLNGIPGVGKKTAERLILEMKDKIAEVLRGDQETERVTVPDSLQSDLVSALVNLGYSRNPAERAVGNVLDRNQDQSFGDLLRESLRKVQSQ